MREKKLSYTTSIRLTQSHLGTIEVLRKQFNLPTQSAAILMAIETIASQIEGMVKTKFGYMSEKELEKKAAEEAMFDPEYIQDPKTDDDFIKNSDIRSTIFVSWLRK